MTRAQFVADRINREKLLEFSVFNERHLIGYSHSHPATMGVTCNKDVGFRWRVFS